MNRRWMFLGGAALALAAPAVRAAVPRRLAFRHAATGASFDGPWDEADPSAMAALSAALADSSAIRPRPFDAEAIGILWGVSTAARLPGPLVVRSGYRTPAINAAVNGAGDSQHLRASALDVEVSAVRMPAVAGIALALGRGGVGMYPSRGFLHLDSGPVRRWSEGSARTVAPVEDRIGRIAAAWRNPGNQR
jgi:uncharacterized protein YcbK (DUF882 family)